MTIRREEPRVLFPWERRRGLAFVFRRARARQASLVLLAAATVLLLGALERRAARVRATRAVITTTINAMDAWRADHDRGCPASLAELVSAGYLVEAPRDAWGGALRVTCPGRKDPKGFDVSSDGPDREPGGLDRVE